MKLKIPVILGILFFFLSCENEEDGHNYFDLGKESEFQINREYLAGNQQVNFSISEISDSRCPTGLYCFWQGMVTVTIAIEKPAIDTITLNSHDQLTGKSNGYKFELGDVTPYPDIETELKKEDYIILMKITK